jgi:hypothetical protein
LPEDTRKYFAYLNDPVNGGDVQAASRHIGGQQNAVLSIAELEEGVGAFLLLLATLET